MKFGKAIKLVKQGKKKLTKMCNRIVAVLGGDVVIWRY